MSADRDVNRIVRSWLEEGVSALPDRVLDTVLDQLPATPQRRAPWPVRRFGEMNNFAKFAVAAAAVALVAVVGIRLLPGQGTTGGPPSPTPTASPASTPAPIREGALAAGSYLIRPFSQPGSAACFDPPQPDCIDSTNDDSVRITFTVPDGWTGATDGAWPTDADPAAADGASLLFIRGASLYDQPCRNASTSPEIPPEIPVGPTVDDFANAIAAHPLLDVTTPVDVTLAGYSGKYLELLVPADISQCDEYRPWEPWYYAQGPGERWHLWILDVGGARVVVQSMDHAETSGQNRTELQAVVDSIQIQR
jgi:hypothetical protein